ncbi:GTPase-activating protein, partial [Gonapodya sp. JEL0774]
MVATCVVGISIALASGWKLTLVVLSLTPLIFVAGRIQIGRQNRQLSRAKVEFEGVSQTATEGIANIKTVASLHRESTFIADYAAELVAPHRRTIQSAWTQSFGNGIMTFVTFGILGLSFWYGTNLVASGEYSAAQM